jgi:hypothetical protein
LSVSHKEGELFENYEPHLDAWLAAPAPLLRVYRLANASRFKDLTCIRLWANNLYEILPSLSTKMFNYLTNHVSCVIDRVPTKPARPQYVP